jgi:hypothetical protein
MPENEPPRLPSDDALITLCARDDRRGLSTPALAEFHRPVNSQLSRPQKPRRVNARN